MRSCLIFVLAVILLLCEDFLCFRQPLCAVAGLLYGISDVANAVDYSRTMNLKDSADMLKDRKYLHSIVTEKEINLPEIISKAKVFIHNQTEIWDRDDLQNALEFVFADESNFVCLLGGKSTGKSLITKNLEQLSMGTIFRVNLRGGSDILTGLKEVLLEQRDYYKFWGNQELTKRIAKFGTLAAEVAVFETIVSALTKILSNRDASLKSLIKELVNSREDKITLIIDEANIAFIIKPETSEDKIEAASEALALFTMLTKESQKV